MSVLRPIRRPNHNRPDGAWLRDAAYHASLLERALEQIHTPKLGGLDIAEQLQAAGWLRVSLVAAARIAGVPPRNGLDGRRRAA